jgi:hypothetical protein
MPIHIRKVYGAHPGYKLSDGLGHRFSKKPMTLARAKKQLQAINISKAIHGYK